MRTLAYIRVSTEEQAREGVSLAHQEAKIAAYCVAKDLPPPTFYRDAGVSAGRALGGRRAGGELLRDIAANGPAHVVALKLDRLFRNAVDCLTTTRGWQDAGCALHLLDMGIDTSTPMGRMFLTMVAGFAELERDLIRERTRAAVQQVQLEGGRVGRAPFGFKYDHRNRDENGRCTLVPCEEEQRVVTRARQLREDGQSWRGTCLALNDEGLTTRKGGPWHVTSLRRILDRGESA